MTVVTVARVSAAIVVVLAIALGIQTCRLSDRDAEVAVRSLERAGWTRSSARPSIPDLPRGAKPAATVSGGVRYLPRRPAPASSAPTNPPVAAGGGCDLNSLTVDVDCRAEIATASGVPVARLWVRGLLTDGAQSRELPWKRVGDPLTIPMPDGGEQPVETPPPDVRVSLPNPRRWWAAVRAGVSDHPELVVGGSAGKGKWGAWVDWRRAAGRETWAGGVEVRF